MIILASHTFLKKEGGSVCVAAASCCEYRATAATGRHHHHQRLASCPPHFSWRQKERVGDAHTLKLWGLS